VAEATILGVWISVKPRAFNVARKPPIAPADRRKTGPPRRVAVDNDGVIEQRRQPGLDLALADQHGQRIRSLLIP
jgi:hypothetical protein